MSIDFDPQLFRISLCQPISTQLKVAYTQAFTELLRVVKPGGLIAWNIADGYEGFNDFFIDYNKIYQQLISEGKWAEVQPVKKLDNMLFDDAGYTYVMRKL